jgi:hypothetical protein
MLLFSRKQFLSSLSMCRCPCPSLVLTDVLSRVWPCLKCRWWRWPASSLSASPSRIKLKATSTRLVCCVLSPMKCLKLSPSKIKLLCISFHGLCYRKKIQKKNYVVLSLRAEIAKHCSNVLRGRRNFETVPLQTLTLLLYDPKPHYILKAYTWHYWAASWSISNTKGPLNKPWCFESAKKSCLYTRMFVCFSAVFSSCDTILHPFDMHGLCSSLSRHAQKLKTTFWCAECEQNINEIRSTLCTIICNQITITLLDVCRAKRIPQYDLNPRVQLLEFKSLHVTSTKSRKQTLDVVVSSSPDFYVFENLL